MEVKRGRSGSSDSRGGFSTTRTLGRAIVEKADQFIADVAGIERHGDAAGLHYPEEDSHELRVAGLYHGHAVALFYAHFYQGMGDPVGILVQLVISDAALAHDNRRFTRRSAYGASSSIDFRFMSRILPFSRFKSR